MTQLLYARVVSGVVVETWPPTGGAMALGITTPEQAFGDDFGENFIACQADVVQGWTYNGTFAAPVTPAPTQGQLLTYAGSKAQSIISAMGSYGASAPILRADRTAQTLTDLLAVEQDAQTLPDDAYNWVANDNSVTAFTATQLAALAPSVATDRKAIFAVLASAVLGISGGTITTTAQIDALSWPT